MKVFRLFGYELILRKPDARPAELPEQEVLLGLAMNDNHPTWKAVRAVLEDNERQFSNVVGDGRMAANPGKLAFAAGQLAAAQAITSRFEAIRGQAWALKSKL